MSTDIHVVGDEPREPGTLPGVEQMKADFDMLRAKLTRQANDAATVDSWLFPYANGFAVPQRAGTEHRALAELSRTPWLRLVVDNVSQAMFVSGVATDEGANPDLWRLWLANDLQSTQVANHRAAVAYGQSFAVVSEAVHHDVPSARIRFMSPRRVAVDFDDPGASLYPAVALEANAAVGRGEGPSKFTLHYPGVNVKVFETAAGITFGRVQRTGLQVVPVVQFANQVDLDGQVTGEVLPFVPTAKRINKTTFDRLLAQHFSSWVTKTVTGIDLPEEVDADGVPTGSIDVEAAREQKMKLAQDDVLIAESPEASFGTLAATQLGPFVESWRSDIEALAAVSQTPAYALTGQLVNLNAEALAAARAPLTQKVSERQVAMSAAYSRVLRLAASFAGLDDIAADDTVRVTWQDMDIRSMSQAVDALGKAASMLGIPKRGLWSKIPGVEDTDVQDWIRLADEDDARDPLTKVFGKNDVTTTDTIDGTDVRDEGA